jgi:superfamily II DNA or RNA helicase
MSKRDEIQQKALGVALRYKKSGLALSMGVGKTLIGLRYINHLQEQNMRKLRVLVVAPKVSIFDSWKNDGEKFNISLDGIEFTTYLSLTKRTPEEYDIVVLDECHSLRESHDAFLSYYNGRILGLTGTPPKYSNSEKGALVSQYCPIMFSYITDDAVDDEILNDYKIIVHYLPLSQAKNIKMTTRDGKAWYISEAHSYGYWSERVYSATTPKAKQIASVMRMKQMQEFKSKEVYAKSLFNSIDDKCILFANTQDQADRLCKHSYHSKNPDSKENLEMFSDGSIDKLSCVLQLSEGVNIPNLKAGIIMHAYGNERKAAQRIGRMLRLSTDQTATIHILCYEDSIDKNWVNEALSSFSSDKITYLKN